MPRAAKYTEVMAVIERRIREGDYLLDVVPGERTIAAETGVSHMTARKAVQALIHKQVLRRADGGGLQVNPQYQAAKKAAQIVLLYPAYPSPFLTQLRQTMSMAAREHGLDLRPVQYVHWHDPVVMDAVRHRGGTFVIPSSSSVPDHIIQAMIDGKCISMDIDLSRYGVRSIVLFPEPHILQVLGHLKKLGYRRINCLSTHVMNTEVQRRIDIWERWIKQHKLDGELWSDPAGSFDDPTPNAYNTMLRKLNEQDLRGTAVIGTTFPAALGANRASWERGLRVSQDISISAVNIEAPARFMTPGITGLDIPNLASIFEPCFDWFLRDEGWHASNVLEPKKSRFYRGESAGSPDSTHGTHLP